MEQSFIYGINPILEAIKASKRRCYKIVVTQGKRPPRLRPILDACKAQGVKVEVLPRDVFQKKYRSVTHQGVIGYFSEKESIPLDELIRRAFEESPQPTLAILDGIQDPQNLGAIIRSAEVLGVQGLVLPQRRVAPLNETVSKCSSGAVENLPVAWVTNLARAMEQLKESKFWIVGVDPRGEKSCDRFKFDMPTALLIGGEEKGIRPLLRKACDFTVSIPMRGAVESLNVSAASAVIFYEILKQKAENLRR